MNNKHGRAILIAALCFVLVSLSYAWFRNNQQVLVSSSDSDLIQIKGNGVMLTAYSTTASGTDIAAAAAAYQSELSLNLSGRYMDVSGDGIHFYEASLDSDGTPKADGWTVAEADTAVSTTDSGSYVVADIYIKSDAQMDIYLMQEAEVSPVTADSGNDLVNKVDSAANKDYSGYTLFSEFNGGLPALNINQSSYGLFSRNLIAGAVRVSFSEYTYDSAGSHWDEPEYPNLVWVPNSTYQLTVPGNSSSLDTMTLTGAKETSYQFHLEDGSLYTITRADNGLLTGRLFIQKTENGQWEDVPDRIISHDQLIPSRIPQGASSPIPRIYLNTDYVDAAYSESLGAFVQAEYADSGNVDNYVYVSRINSVTYYVQKTSDGYVKCTKTNGDWKATSTKYTAATSPTAAQIEAGFQTDTASYRRSYWIDDDGFTGGQDKISRYKIATTGPIDTSGNYYTRIRVAIWVEGYDRESDIALNSGEFGVNLKFYGVETQ